MLADTLCAGDADDRAEIRLGLRRVTELVFLFRHQALMARHTEVTGLRTDLGNFSEPGDEVIKNRFVHVDTL